MNLISQYILKKFSFYFIVILLALELFFVGLDLLANASSLPDSANLKVLYVVFMTFFALSTTMPLAIVFAWITTIIDFVKSSEMVAFIAIGAHTRDIIIAPLIATFVLIAILIGISASPLAYSSEQKSKILNNKFFSSERDNIFFKHNEYFVHFEKLLPISKEAVNVTIFKTKDEDLEKIYYSSRGKFLDNIWEFENVKITTKPIQINFENSKLTEEFVPKMKLLEGFKPKILDAAYEPKSGYSTLDAIDSFQILNSQNINTDKIRASLYNQIFVPFFIIPIIFLIYKYANINSRFFRPTEFASIWVFGTLFVWGGFFLLYRFSSNSVIMPEIGILGPLFTMFALSFFAYKNSKKVKI